MNCLAIAVALFLGPVDEEQAVPAQTAQEAEAVDALSVGSVQATQQEVAGTPEEIVPVPDLVPVPARVPVEVKTDQDEIVVNAPARESADDPFRQVNAASYALIEKVDHAVTGPAARAFKHIVPKPLRTGLRNFFNNLREPVVFINYVAQLKVGKAAETVGRFVINSTLGLGGVIDVAKRCPIGLPWRPNGFSDTLGVYGVRTGPYFFIPLIGPATVRDLIGGVVDRLASPFALNGPFRTRPYLVGTSAFRVLDRRAEQDDALAAIQESDDPYSARRDRYLRGRRDRVTGLKGNAHERDSNGALARPSRCARAPDPVSPRDANAGSVEGLSRRDGVSPEQPTDGE